MSKEFWEYYLYINTGKKVKITKKEIAQANENILNSGMNIFEVMNECGYLKWRRKHEQSLCRYEKGSS